MHLTFHPGSEFREILLIEWARIVAFRNVLVHNYPGVDMERIREILQRDVPALKQTVLSMVEEIAR